MPEVLGIMPTVISAWEPSAVRPSSSVTTTPWGVRLTEAALERPMTFMPRRR